MKMESCPDCGKKIEITDVYSKDSRIVQKTKLYTW